MATTELKLVFKVFAHTSAFNKQIEAKTAAKEQGHEFKAAPGSIAEKGLLLLNNVVLCGFYLRACNYVVRRSMHAGDADGQLALCVFLPYTGTEASKQIQVF